MQIFLDASPEHNNKDAILTSLKSRCIILSAKGLHWIAVMIVLYHAPFEHNKKDAMMASFKIYSSLRNFPQLSQPISWRTFHRIARAAQLKRAIFALKPNARTCGFGAIYVRHGK